ncbi:uncharacterized protein LOC113475042 isoform X2 [Ciona intestinalis]
MGINVSRGRKKVLRHDDVTTSRNTNLGHRYGHDIRKRALQAEYEAWLRSLGPVDHVGESHVVGGQGKSLFRKVTSLLSSKQHRKTPIVWPHDVRKGDVIPKIRLSFAESKKTRELPPLPRKESKKEINSFAPPSDEDFYSWSFQSSGTDKRGQRWDQRPREQTQKKETSGIAKSGYPERRHTWEIPFDYNAIQGSSCIVGPKVLPTLSPSSGYQLATSRAHKARYVLGFIASYYVIMNPRLAAIRSPRTKEQDHVTNMTMRILHHQEVVPPNRYRYPRTGS